MSKNKKILIIVIILLGVTILSVWNLSQRDDSRASAPQTHGENSPVERETAELSIETVTLEINGTQYESMISAPTNVYNFMDQLREEGKINFTKKSYVGMGKFINSINGVDNNGSENWIYYVNGVKAQVGVSSYEIKPGDVVSWKYEKFSY